MPAGPSAPHAPKHPTTAIVKRPCVAMQHGFFACDPRSVPKHPKSTTKKQNCYKRGEACATEAVATLHTAPRNQRTVTESIPSSTGGYVPRLHHRGACGKFARPNNNKTPIVELGNDDTTACLRKCCQIKYQHRLPGVKTRLKTACLTLSPHLVLGGRRVVRRPDDHRPVHRVKTNQQQHDTRTVTGARVGWWE